MTDLRTKVALITGGRRGIGKAVAERYGALGASVVINYASSENAAKETVAVIEHSGCTAIAVRADVSKVANTECLFQTILERFGHPDIVVVNAGLEVCGHFIDGVLGHALDFELAALVQVAGALRCRDTRSAAKEDDNGG